MKDRHEISSGAYANMAMLILCFCYFVPNYAQYQVSPLGPTVMEQFGLSTGQLSALFSAPMIPAVFLSLLGGVLIDKLGPKLVIGTGICIAAGGCVLRVFAGSYAVLLIATALTGFAAVFINAGGGKLLGGLYGAEKVNEKMGILMAASTAGMALSMFTSARFPNIKAAFGTTAVLSAVSAVLWVVFMKNPVESRQEEDTQMPSLKECILMAAGCRDVWLVGIAMFFIMAANVVISSFLPTALSTRGIGAVTAGNLGTFLTLGNFLGCFTAPAMIRKTGSQKRVLFASGLLAGAGIAASWMIPWIPVMAAALLLTGMFLGGMIPTLMALPVQFREIGPVYAGTAGGIVGTVQLLGAVLVPSYIIAPIAGSNFALLFLLGGACMALASAVTLFLRA